MFAANCVMAFTLLTSPPGAVDLKHPPPGYDALRPVLRQLAVKMELLDPRETQYVLARSEDFLVDLKLLRRRYHNLMDAPPVSECQRFPDRQTINQLLTWNRSYRRFLKVRMACDLVHPEEWRDALEETDRLYQVWDAVRDARCKYYYITVRREALKQLREMIGMPAFYRGELPPHLPVWRLPEID
jgi:hypothetical protein